MALEAVTRSRHATIRGVPSRSEERGVIQQVRDRSRSRSVRPSARKWIEPWPAIPRVRRRGPLLRGPCDGWGHVGSAEDTGPLEDGLRRDVLRRLVFGRRRVLGGGVLTPRFDRAADARRHHGRHRCDQSRMSHATRLTRDNRAVHTKSRPRSKSMSPEASHGPKVEMRPTRGTPISVLVQREWSHGIRWLRARTRRRPAVPSQAACSATSRSMAAAMRRRERRGAADFHVDVGGEDLVGRRQHFGRHPWS